MQVINAQNNTKKSTTLSDVFLRGFVGGCSGLIGFFVLGMILLLTWSIVGSTLAPTTENLVNEYGETIQKTHPLFLSIVIVSVFLAALAANLSQIFIISSTYGSYSKSRMTNLTQVFCGNLMLLILMIPVYAVASGGYGSAGIAFVAAAHAVISGFMSYLIMEIISALRSPLLSLYGVILGLALFFLIINMVGSTNPTIVSLITFPVLLGGVGMGIGIADMLYEWIVKSYGSDFLDTNKRFGGDYGRKETIEAEVDTGEWEI